NPVELVKTLAPTTMLSALTPSVGKSANPLSATKLVALKPCVGSALFERATSTEFPVLGVVISTANQRWLAGSKMIRVSLRPGLSSAAPMPAFDQNEVSLTFDTTDPSDLL